MIGKTKINLIRIAESLVIVLILSVAFVILQNSFDKKHQELLTHNNTEYSKREDIASKERLQIKNDQELIRSEVARVEGKIDVNIIETKSVRTDLRTSFNSLNKFKNEKDFIPSNTSVNQQYEFLKGAKYEPYE